MGLALFAVADIRRAARKIRPALGDGTSTLITLHVATGVIQLGRNLILSRLFVPEAYGAVGIITAIATVLSMATDLGMRSFITRHPTADEGLLQTVWSVRVVRNVLLAALMFLAAEPLASLYSAPELTLGVQVAAGLFLFEAVSSLTFLYAERERRVIRLSVIDFASRLIITAVSIVAAYYLRTYWAVLIGMFASSAFNAYASYRFVPGPPMRLRFDRQHVIDLLQFSKVIAPASMITIILLQTDKFFLANFFPLAELGKYMLATAIALSAQALIQQYVMRVAYPLIAQVMRETPDQALKTYYGSRRRFTLVLAFGIGGVIGGAALVTQILFNDDYIGAGFYLSLLCLGPLALLTVMPAQQALIAKGYVRIELIANLIRLAWVAIAGPIAFLQFGAMGVVVVMCLVQYAALPYCWWSLSRYGLFSAREEFYLFAVAALGAAIGYGAQSASQWLVAAGYLPSF